VKISVSDTGDGIRPDILSKIFDPFFTTKDSGNGLGLAVTFSILQQHGGYITVESSPGRGTRFDMYLPASTAPPPRVEAAREEPSRTARKILVMDDEPMVLDVAVRMLEHLGYTVSTATGGAEAVELYRRALGAGGRFECVIMDLTIPGGMGGGDAVKRLREMDPGVIAIVSSGYSKDPVVARYREYGFSGVLEKPYRIELLHEVIERVCGNEHP